MLQDLRYGLRMLVERPGFTAVAVGALALGIGVNSAVFSVVNSVLLRPIALSHSDRLVMLWNRSPGLNVLEDWLSPAEYFDIKQAGSFDAAAIAFVNTVNLTDLNSGADERPERVGGAQVSSSLFAMLEARPALGRLFLPEEDLPGSRLTAVISNALWRRRFSSDPGVVGKSVTLDGKEYSVIGVLPADFGLNNETLPAYHPVEDVDVFMVLPLAPAAAQDRRHEDFTVLARLKPTVSATQAQAEIDTIVARLRHDYPQNYPPNAGFTISVVPVLQHAVGGMRPLLLILLGAVAFVLLIACANVANLLLSRAAARRHEIAIRTAMGASRLRLVRQFLTESLLLALTGGALGLVLTFWGVHGLRVLNPANVPRISEIAVDGRVVGFTLAVSLLTGILFGLVPALRASQIDFNEMLKEGGRDRMGGAHARGARGLLVVSEIALSLILLAGAGLLIRSFLSLQAVSPGFNTSNVISMHLGLAGAKYAKPESRGLFYDDLRKRIGRLPGVESAGAISELPLSGELAWTPIWVDGYVAKPGETLIQSDLHVATADYFRTMRIPLVSGRYFNEQDSKDSRKVAIVDESLARYFMPDQDPIGKRLKLGDQSSEAPWMTIIGLVKDVKQYGLDATPRITCYLAHTQYPTPGMYVVVRAASTAGLLSAVTGEVRALDSDLPIYDVRLMNERVAASLGRRRFSMMMLFGFAILALALAVIGIYGVVSYSVAQQTREIGVRMALGAGPADILKMVGRNGLAVSGLGVGIGLIGALALTRLMSGLLYGVSARDPVTFTGVAVLLIVVGVVAHLIPGRRAARVDPIAALRQE